VSPGSGAAMMVSRPATRPKGSWYVGSGSPFNSTTRPVVEDGIGFAIAGSDDAVGPNDDRGRNDDFGRIEVDVFIDLVVWIDDLERTEVDAREDVVVRTDVPVTHNVFDWSTVVVPNGVVERNVVVRRPNAAEVMAIAEKDDNLMVLGGEKLRGERALCGEKTSCR
jgi:hypothetical protein